jgi:hypothetical protein
VQEAAHVEVEKAAQKTVKSRRRVQDRGEARSRSTTC